MSAEFLLKGSFRTALLLIGMLHAPAVSGAPLRFGPPPVLENAAEQQANMSRSMRKLESLQRAASACDDMRLLLVYSADSRMRRPTELARISAADKAQFKALIARMSAVKYAPSPIPHAALVIRLELLGQREKVLDSVEYLDVASEALVNAQGYADGARLLLRGGDAASWHQLMRVDHARAIAANPAPARLRNRPIRFATKPEPPRPDPEPEFPERYFHADCKDNHCGHEHSSKNHYCDHPQKR